MQALCQKYNAHTRRGNFLFRYLLHCCLRESHKLHFSTDKIRIERKFNTFNTTNLQQQNTCYLFFCYFESYTNNKCKYIIFSLRVFNTLKCCCMLIDMLRSKVVGEGAGQAASVKIEKTCWKRIVDPLQHSRRRCGQLPLPSSKRSFMLHARRSQFPSITRKLTRALKLMWHADAQKYQFFTGFTFTPSRALLLKKQ